jgi:hypothetical protein
MRLKITLWIGFFFFTGILNAQSDFRSGYIINNNGDTIFGNIDYRGDLLMGRICRFKNSDNSITTYSPTQIAAYRFNDGKYYISREIKGNVHFLEFLINGKVNMYYLRDEGGDHYFIDKEGYEMNEILYTQEIRFVDEKNRLYQSKKHIGLLTYYMQDAPELQHKINRIVKPEHKNLLKIAEEYHNIVCNGEECIIYEKNQPLLKVNLEVLGGMVNYENVVGLSDKFYFQGGIIANLWMPRVNEKIYFRTGLLRSDINEFNGREVLYKIPLQIEYIYSKSLINPKIALGINYYKPFYQTVAFMAGLNVRLSKSINWSINYEIDFNPNTQFVLIPDSKFSDNMLTGICIKF